MAKRITESSGVGQKRIVLAQAPALQSISQIVAAIGDKAGKARKRRLPRDLARNHDKYLYGVAAKPR